MEHVSSVRPTGKFPEKVENLKRWSRFPGWNFRTECRVPLTFLVVCTSSRSTVGHPATYRGLRPNGTTFYQSEIPLLLPPIFPGFFRKWKAPCIFTFPLTLGCPLKRASAAFSFIKKFSSKPALQNRFVHPRATVTHSKKKAKFSHHSYWFRKL